MSAATWLTHQRCGKDDGLHLAALWRISSMRGVGLVRPLNLVLVSRAVVLGTRVENS
jgi:hypothetical protein